MGKVFNCYMTFMSIQLVLVNKRESDGTGKIMCNRSIPSGIGSLPEKPPSDSILSRASSAHTNAPSCCYGSCWLTLLTDITCPASAIIGCYLWRQTALGLWIQSCGYNCAAFHSGFPTNDIRSEKTRDFQTAQMLLVSFYSRCHQ